MGLLKTVGADTRWVSDTQRVVTSGVLWYTAHLAVGLAFLKMGTHTFVLREASVSPRHGVEHWQGFLGSWTSPISGSWTMKPEQSHPHPVPGTQKKEVMPETHPELSWPLTSLESSWRKETKQ